MKATHPVVVTVLTGRKGTAAAAHPVVLVSGSKGTAGQVDRSGFGPPPWTTEESRETERWTVHPIGGEPFTVSAVENSDGRHLVAILRCDPAVANTMDRQGINPALAVDLWTVIPVAVASVEAARTVVRRLIHTMLDAPGIDMPPTTPTSQATLIVVVDTLARIVGENLALTASRTA